MKIIKLFFLGFAFSVCAQKNAEFLEFEDFPLRKIDTIYSKNGDRVANLIFNVMKSLSLLSSELHTRFTDQENEDALIFLKNKCTHEIHACCVKLKTFKRFTNELIKEWVKKRNKTERTELLLNSLFLCYKSKKYIEEMELTEVQELLEDLTIFIKDIYHNGPYAVEKCKKHLSDNDNVVFDNFFVKKDFFSRS